MDGLGWMVKKRDELLPNLLEIPKNSRHPKADICLRFQTYAHPIWLASIFPAKIATSVAICQPIDMMTYPFRIPVAKPFGFNP